MFIEQGIKRENPFWKYLVGSILIVIASVVGQIPLGIAIAVKSFDGGGAMPSSTDELLKVLEPNLSLFLMLLTFVFAIIGIYLVIKYFHNQTFLSVTTSRSKVDYKRIFFSFTIWTIITILSTVLLYYVSPENFVWNFKPIPFAILAIIGIIMIPIQTSTEEYIFRGYLMQGFGNLSKNRWFPLLMTSVLFGGMHIMNPEVEKMGYIIMIYYIGTGLFLGIITLMDEGMELALGFHAANNLIGALLVTTDWSAFQTHSILKDTSEPKAGLDIFIPVLIIFPLLLFVFGKKYNWTNWKEKLTGDIIETKINQTPIDYD